MRRILTLAAALVVSGPASAGILVSDENPFTLNFNNLNSNFGGAFNATGGSSLFPTASDPTGTSTTTIYSGSVTPGFTVNTDDFNPGGLYSNTDTYSNSNSVRALRDGTTSDYAIGAKDSTDRSFILTLTNNSGAPITSFALAYAIEQYSTGASATTFRLSYSVDGTNFITTNMVGGADVVGATTVTADGNLASVLSTSRTATINETIANGADLQVRWFYDHISGTSAHVGIDDITVTATVPEPAGIAVAAIAGLGLLSRRNRRRQ